MKHGIFTFLLFFIFFTAQALADTFLLETPIARVTKLPGGPSVSTGLMLLPNLADAGVYYAATGDSITSTIMFTYCAFNKIPEIVVVSRVATLLYESKKYLDMKKKVSCSPGTKSIQILETRFTTYPWMVGTEINTSSIIFANMEEGKIPNPIDGSRWINLNELKDTKIKLNLILPTGQVADSIDLDIADLLSKDGARIDQEVMLKWQKKFREWDKSRSFISRWITGSGKYNTSINATLVSEDAEFSLGLYTEGRGVRNFMGIGRMKLPNFTDRNVATQAKNSIRTKNHQIIPEENCLKWYQKILGVK